MEWLFRLRFAGCVKLIVGLLMSLKEEVSDNGAAILKVHSWERTRRNCSLNISQSEI